MTSKDEQTPVDNAGNLSRQTAHGWRDPTQHVGGVAYEKFSVIRCPFTPRLNEFHECWKGDERHNVSTSSRSDDALAMFVLRTRITEICETFLHDAGTPMVGVHSIPQFTPLTWHRRAQRTNCRFAICSVELQEGQRQATKVAILAKYGLHLAVPRRISERAHDTYFILTSDCDPDVVSGARWKRPKLAAAMQEARRAFQSRRSQALVNDCVLW